LFEGLIIQPISLVDMDTSLSTESSFGMLVYFLFLLVAVFVGALEAVMILILYWLLGNDAEQRQTPS
jgi:hypothetical protein